MKPKPGQALELVDAQGRHLGRMTLEGGREGLLEGQFTPGPDYPAVESLFRALEEAADAQALSAVDRLDAKIASLGLHLRSEGGASPVPVHDVQIWADGAMSCRVSPSAPPPFNGSYAANRASPETHKGAESM
jgi:hypothetical protein